MHIPRWFLWLLLYLAGFFAWIVYLEYGASQWKTGAVIEVRRAWEWAGQSIDSWLPK